jgi:hypothetical protein
MRALEDWLINSGNRVATELDRRADIICKNVSQQLERNFVQMGYNPERIDAVEFQQKMFVESPRRMHRLVQTALRLRAVEIIERECKWLLTALPIHGIERHQMYAMVRWYFESARTFAIIDSADRRSLDILEQVFLHALEYKPIAARV